MSTCRTLLHKFSKGNAVYQRFHTGVSLHSHTMHSKEFLDRLPGYIQKVPIGAYILEREIGRLHLYTGRIFDFKKIYWTPPLSPREAYELESSQIRNDLGLKPIVSLSDHDSIEAGLHLRMLPATSKAPVSVEWSVPYGNTVFHIGIHNLPATTARLWMEIFAEYTRKPSKEQLSEILTALNELRSILIVLNHPYWDAEAIGPDAHRAELSCFLQEMGFAIHALELNGMRSRKENRAVVKLAEETEFPVVSGGDRHGCEPNATLNLTNSSTVEEFVEEIRVERRSEVMLMPQYFEPLQLRLLENAWHALADAPGEFGRRHWMTRVFVQEDGLDKPLSEYNGTRFERIVDKFRWVMSLVASPKLRPALRLPFTGNEEGGL